MDCLLWHAAGRLDALTARRGPCTAGLLCKGADRRERLLASLAAGGTYAHIYVAPHEEAAGLAPAATNAPVGHQADRRCRVEIRRI